MFDIFIVGGGPAGMTAAIYAVRAGYKIGMTEQNFCGGQTAEAAQIENYPGFVSISGFELASKLEQQVRNTDAQIIVKSVREIKNDGNMKRIITDDGSEYSARAVILSMGAGKRKLDCKGEKEFAGRGVSYCATCDGNFFKGKDAAVVGGGNTALGDALYLARICRKVFLIHRRDEFRGTKILLERAEAAENITIIRNSVVREIYGDSAVTGISVENKLSGEQKQIDVSAVFCAVGTAPNSDIVSGSVKTDEKGYIIAGEDCVTSEPGIFAAGDIRTKKLRQIITAAADGANAALSAEQYLSELSKQK